MRGFTQKELGCERFQPWSLGFNLIIGFVVLYVRNKQNWYWFMVQHLYKKYGIVI